MTVKELIGQLKKLKPEHRVLLARDPEINSAYDILWIQEWDDQTHIILPDETTDYVEPLYDLAAFKLGIAKNRR